MIFSIFQCLLALEATCGECVIAITWFFFDILFIFSETFEAIFPLSPLSTSSKIRVKLPSLSAESDLIIKSNLDNSPPEATFLIELNSEFLFVLNNTSNSSYPSES